METTPPERNDPLFNTSLDKGLAVLSAFRGRRSLSLREVAEALGITKSSAQRIVYTLEKLGFVRRPEPGAKYQLTLKMMELGFAYLSNDSLIEVGGAFLSELTNATGETCNLTEPLETNMVYVSRVVSPQFIPIHLAIGSRIPMYCTASGRAYLSALPEEEALALITASPLEKHTYWTETDPEKIMMLLVQAKRDGFASNKEEYILGDMTIGAPVMGRSGRPLGAVHVVAPTSRWTLESACAKLAPHVIKSARGIGTAVHAAT